MFIWLRNQRKIIATAMIIVFSSGYAAFFCPHCQAKVVSEMAVMSESDNNHCSHMQKDSEKTVPDQHGNNFPDTCLCCDHDLMTADKRLIMVNDNRVLVHISAITENIFIQPDLLPVYKQLPAGRPYKPDRACYPPLERICVLLN